MGKSNTRKQTKEIKQEVKRDNGNTDTNEPNAGELTN